MPIEHVKPMTDGQRRRTLHWIVVGQVIVTLLIFIGVAMAQWLPGLVQVVVG